MYGYSSLISQYMVVVVGLLSIGSTPLAQEMPMDHSHMPIEVPADAPAPLLSLVLSRDAMSGFNLELRTEKFALIPPPPGALSMDDLMTPTVDPSSGYVEGHAHLYVNGEKVQRLYGRDVHLPASLFRPGVNQVTVTINNHGHMYWTVDDRQVLATLYINPPAEDAVAYRFESFPVEKSNQSDLSRRDGA